MAQTFFPRYQGVILVPEGVRWLKWLERKFTDRKVCGSNPNSASRLPLSRLGQPGSPPDERLLRPSQTNQVERPADDSNIFLNLHFFGLPGPLNFSVCMNIQFHPASTDASATVPWDVNRHCSAVTPFRCLAAMLPEGSTRAGILPGCPSLDRGSREAEFRFEPRTLRSVNSRSNHLSHLAPRRASEKRLQLKLSFFHFHILLLLHSLITNSILVAPSVNPDDPLIVKKRIKVDREGTYCQLTTIIPRCLHLQTLIQSIWMENDNRTPLTSASSVPNEAHVGHLCFRRSELSTECSALSGKPWLGIHNAWPNQHSFWCWTHSTMESLVAQSKTRFLKASLRIGRHQTIRANASRALHICAFSSSVTLQSEPIQLPRDVKRSITSPFGELSVYSYMFGSLRIQRTYYGYKLPAHVSGTDRSTESNASWKSRNIKIVGHLFLWNLFILTYTHQCQAVQCESKSSLLSCLFQSAGIGSGQIDGASRLED
ncbi:hypothetical protein CSKR_100924 [Clonorchis sinensis]|uniref:Uncharacterized protein n=1 Tax=Clonorchis sinensis TaxID=79923 RepID=A0A419Q4T0_CLOSI|nr:hypothetical protein CSKR_100924 [Clonorchis sinensis]